MFLKKGKLSTVICQIFIYGIYNVLNMCKCIQTIMPNNLGF